MRDTSINSTGIRIPDSQKPVVQGRIGTFNGINITVIPIERKILDTSLSHQRIDLGQPSRIDFNKLDLKIKSQFSTPLDQQFALGAMHVTKYAEKLSDIQDLLLSGTADTTGIKVIGNTLESLESQIADDTHLLENSNDRLAIEAYLSEVKELVGSFSETLHTLQEVKEQLVAGSNDFPTLKNSVQGITNSIKTNQGFNLENGIYRTPLLKGADELQDWLNERKLQVINTLIEQHIPILKNRSNSNSLNQKCMDSLVKLYDHGFLRNKSFLQRLNMLLTGKLTGQQNSEETVRKTFSSDEIENGFLLANKNLPDLAKGDPSSVDMVLKGPQWDNFALQMKLTLNDGSDFDSEKVEIFHRCTIAKRELAHLLQIKTGHFRQDEHFQSDFHDVRFDDTFIKGLLGNSKLQYGKVDLMLANVLILEAKGDGSLDVKNSESVKTFAGKLRLLGFTESFENIEKHISKDFRSTGDVRKTARAVENFARSLSKNSLAFTAFTRACRQSPRVKAREMLDVVLRNFTDVQSTDILRFSEIQNIVAGKNIEQFLKLAKNESGIKKLHKAKEQILEWNKIAVSAGFEVSRLELELDFIEEQITGYKKILTGIDQSNPEKPNGRDSCVQILSVFEDFQQLDSDNPDTDLLNKLKKSLLHFKNFRIETMHTGGNKGEATRKLGNILNTLEGATSNIAISNKIHIVMNLLAEHRVQEKAQAIVALRGAAKNTPGLLGRRSILKSGINKQNTLQKNIITKLHGLLPKESRAVIHRTIQAVILNEFIGSGARTLNDFNPDRGKIISTLSINLGIPDYAFSGELAMVFKSLTNGDILAIWDREIVLDSSISKESRRMLRKIPGEHLEIIRQNEWETKISEQVGNMEDNQEFSLTFGESMTLHSGEIPVGGPVSLEVSLTMAQDNSLSISRAGQGFTVLIKGGRSVGGGINLSSFLNALDVGVEVKGSQAKGCQMTFANEDDCKKFLSGLMTGKAPVSSWINAEKIRLVRETLLSGGVTVEVGLPDIVPKQVSSKLGEHDIGVSSALDGEVSGQVTWTEQGSASQRIRTKKSSFSLSISGNISLEGEKIIGGEQISTSIEQEKSVSFSRTLAVTKTSQMVYQYGVISPDSNIKRSFKAGNRPLQTLLHLLKSASLTFPENDPRLNSISELANHAGETDIFEISWKLNSDVALQIAELQFAGNHTDADNLLKNPENFIPFQLLLISEEKISLEESRSLKYVEMTNFAESGNINRMVVDLNV